MSSALAIEQITFARKYSLRLIDAVAAADWFRMPADGVTHVAWQVGHLAMAEYRMCLDRLRGRQPGDGRIIPEDFLIQFGRDSTPEPDPARYPKPAEIRDVLERVHQQALAELQRYSEAELQEPAVRPHPMFTTKLGGLFWCAQHELIHAGQIALLRRLLGAQPLWLFPGRSLVTWRNKDGPADNGCQPALHGCRRPNADHFLVKNASITSRSRTPASSVGSMSS
jgi:uncharacterized damage-inducible protein DinB